MYFLKNKLPTCSQLLPVHPSAHLQVYVDPVVEHSPPFIQYPEYEQSEISVRYVIDICIMLPFLLHVVFTERRHLKLCVCPHVYIASVYLWCCSICWSSQENSDSGIPASRRTDTQSPLPDNCASSLKKLLKWFYLKTLVYRLEF